MAEMFAFFRYFQVELFLFIFIFSIAVEDVTVTLLAQDKICMRRLNSSEICSNLSRLSSTHFLTNGSNEDDDQLRLLQHEKDAILVEVTTFNWYQSLIYTVPVIMSSMFLSSWADRHKSSTKTLICLTAFMAGLESVYILGCAVYFRSDVNLMLVAFIFFPLVGGSQSLGMAAISYLSSTTDSGDRVKRFSILELTYILSHPMGIFVGGLLIQSSQLSDWTRSNGQLHNYHHVIALAAVGKFVAFGYAAVMRFKPRTTAIYFKAGAKTAEVPARASSCDEKLPLLYEPTKSIKVQHPSSTRFQKFVNNSTDLFVWRNIWESFEVCIQKRPHGIHVMIWLLLTIQTIVTMTNRSAGVLWFQFVQKLYHWDAGDYSRYNSALYLGTHMFGLLCVTPILTKLLKISDSTLLILGLISLLSQNAIRGTLLYVEAFCVSYLFGSITSIIAVAVRTKLSRLAPPTEQNRIFGVLTMLETIAPLGGITLYTAIFNETISYYPGFVFQLSCAILLIPAVLAVYIAAQPPVMASATPRGSLSAHGALLVPGDPNNNGEDDDLHASSRSTARTASFSFSTSSCESKKTVISII